MHTRLQIPSDDSDLERHLQQSAKDRISGVVIQGGQSRTLLLADLGEQLGELRSNLNKRLQGTDRKLTDVVWKRYVPNVIFFPV